MLLDDLGVTFCCLYDFGLCHCHRAHSRLSFCINRSGPVPGSIGVVVPVGEETVASLLEAFDEVRDRVSNLQGQQLVLGDGTGRGQLGVPMSRDLLSRVEIDPPQSSSPRASG